MITLSQRQHNGKVRHVLVARSCVVKVEPVIRYEPFGKCKMRYVTVTLADHSIESHDGTLEDFILLWENTQ